jgi:hypothetical protein
MEGGDGGMRARSRQPKGALHATIALAWGIVVAVAGYAAVRAVQFFVYPDPNPATLVWSAHAGYFWRAWTVGYAGGIAAFVAFLVVRRSAAAATRALPVAVGVAAAALALQSALLP